MAPKTRPRRPLQESNVGVGKAIGSQPNFFLRTKLLPPRPAPELLSRPRLTERLAANLANPLTVITANAGSGKTTLVADFLRHQERQFVWYQLDHTDADPSVFLGYLTFGIQQLVPDFGQAMFSYIQEVAEELAKYPERAVDVLLNEVLERVEQQLILVLDDYHHLGTDTPVHPVLDRLLAYLPDVLHIILISREMPPLSLARLKTQTPLATIDRSDLLFTDNETQELFRQVFDLEMTPEQLAEYREHTHGWITALQLVRQVAQRFLSNSHAEQEKAPDLVAVLRQSERDIFDYFAEEVFSNEPDEVQQLLLRLSLLDTIELDSCAALYPGTNCARLLPNLVRRNVFITVAGDRNAEEYRLHPLFQSFLRRRLRTEIGRMAVAEEQKRLAAYFLDHRAWEQAVRHLLAAEDYEAAAAIISEHGLEWISSGALNSLASLTDSLPTTAIDKYPRALANRAEVARLRGEYDVAQSTFRRAAGLLQQAGDAEGQAEVLHSLATIARRQANYNEAFDYLDKAIELSDERAAVRTKCGNTRGLCLVAMGQWTDAEREFRNALQLAEERNDERYIRLITHNVGLPPMVRGDFGEALRWLQRMLRGGAERPLPQEATAHLNMARCYLYSGELVACEQNLDKAIERCQQFNLIGPQAETFETYGNLYRERGEFERAHEYYERASRAYGQLGINLVRTELLEERALLSLQMGNVDGARNQIDRLVEARSADREDLGYFTASLAQARIMIAQRVFEETIEQLQRVRDYFQEHTLYFYEAQSSMALAVCDFHLNHEPEMLGHLRRAIDLAVRYDYEHWLKREIASYPELFAVEETAEMLPPDLRAQATGTSSIPDVIEVKTPGRVGAPAVTDLTIRMLGPVEIIRDPNRPLPADAWTTRRSRDILCFIGSRRNRRASKDTIIDTFWGEMSPEVVERNFHPTVSHIRKALNRNQPLKQNFLLYRDGDYQLNPEFSYYIDTEEFDRLVEQGESVRRARQFDECIQSYEKAVEIYRGEFMQGSYDPWVDEQRTYYREQYLRLLEALARAAQELKEWPRALNLAQKILREDQFREDIHCMVMQIQAALGNRAAVKDQFEVLRKLLGEELDVEPESGTRKLYQELIGPK